MLPRRTVMLPFEPASLWACNVHPLQPVSVARRFPGGQRVFRDGHLLCYVSPAACTIRRCPSRFKLFEPGLDWGGLFFLLVWIQFSAAECSKAAARPDHSGTSQTSPGDRGGLHVPT
jgi:hypothetical protein